MHIPGGDFPYMSQQHTCRKHRTCTLSLIITHSLHEPLLTHVCYQYAQIPSALGYYLSPWFLSNRSRSQRTRYSLCGSGTVIDLHVCLSVTEQWAGGFYFIAEGRHEGKTPRIINKETVNVG